MFCYYVVAIPISFSTAFILKWGLQGLWSGVAIALGLTSALEGWFDVKAKAREDAHLKLFNVFVLVGYNYWKMIPYNAGNSNGKMTSKCYTEQILAQILDDFRSQGLILVHDSDSAHLSDITTNWVESNGLTWCIS